MENKDNHAKNMTNKKLNKSTQGVAPNVLGNGSNGFKSGKRDNKSFRKGRKEREKSEFEQKLVDLSRVNRVTKAGKQLAFRALVVLGDKKGRVGFGVEKGADVTIAVSKAVGQAKKSIIKINMVDGTIPHEVRKKFKAAHVMIKPAPKGTGVRAGGALQVILDLAGIENVVGKIMGSANKINNVRCAYNALASLKVPRNKKKVEMKKQEIDKVKNEVKEEK